MLNKATPERVSTFSDGVFAVLITVLVLDMRLPETPTYGALLGLWPQWLSYAVSYVFIAIVWELVEMNPAAEASSRVRRAMHGRAVATLCLFGMAAGVALIAPYAGLAICICCLLVYLRPDPPGRSQTP